MHVMIVPDICIELHQSLRTYFAVNKEIFVLVLLKISLININSQNYGTSCNNRWTVLQKLGIITLKFANLIGHIVDSSIQIVIQDAQEAFHRLNWSREVKIKPHHLQYVVLQVDQLLLTYKFFFVLCQQVDHSGKTGGNWLLQLCSHQN